MGLPDVAAKAFCRGRIYGRPIYHRGGCSVPRGPQLEDCSEMLPTTNSTYPAFVAFSSSAITSRGGGIRWPVPGQGSSSKPPDNVHDEYEVQPEQDPRGGI